jgi:hypothetical protein
VEVSRPYLAVKRDWVAELVHRIDHKIAVLGGFSFDYSTGAAYMRNGVDFDGQQVTVEAVERMMNAVAFPIEVFSTAFDLINTSASPRKAVDTALLLHNCPEYADRPGDALKTMLTVEKGGGGPISVTTVKVPLALI